MAALSGSVPFDGYCLFGTDPLSGVRTFMYSRHGLDGVAEQLTYNEFVEVDANRYRDLSTAPRPIGVMSRADPRGRRSPRMHDMLRPTGFGSELRLVLRSGGWVYGGISLFREAGAQPFGDADVERAMNLAPDLRQAVQTHPVRPTPGPTAPMPTGVILINASNQVLAQTAAADRWLEELCIGGGDEMTPADHMRMILDVANASRTADGPAVCRTRTATGRWLLVEAAPLDSFPADTAITLRTADLASLLPAVGRVVRPDAPRARGPRSSGAGDAREAHRPRPRSGDIDRQRTPAVDLSQGRRDGARAAARFPHLRAGTTERPRRRTDPGQRFSAYQVSWMVRRSTTLCRA